jgi:hypothetical protein
MTYLIKIMEHGKDEPFKTMEATSERMAEKIDRGANINLNHEKFYTTIEERL